MNQDNTPKPGENQSKEQQQDIDNVKQGIGNIKTEGHKNITTIIQAGKSATLNQQNTLNQNTLIQYNVEDKSRVALMELLKSCTVKLSFSGESGLSTGFFIAPGKILTCAQAVKDADEQPIKVFWQEQESLEAQISDLKLRIGLAVLDISSTPLNHPCVYLDKAIQVGDELYTYGYSDEFDKGGSVEALYEGHKENDPKIIKFKVKQTTPELEDVPLSQGAPLLNWKTLKVCGIVTSTGTSNSHMLGEALSAGTVLEEINKLKDEQSKFHQKDPRWRNLLPLVRCKLRTVLLTSLGITILVILVRAFQVFQPLELSFYDQLISHRLNPPKPDDRLLIVRVTQEDVEAQEKRKEVMKDSLSNETLTQLLQKIETKLDPIAIGLDIYRDQPLDEQNEKEKKLKELFQSSNLLAVCKVIYDGRDTPPPPGVSSEQVGFSDFLPDSDDVLRRQLLAFDTDTESRCKAEKSFSLLLAEHYLEEIHNIQIESNKNKVDETSICPIQFSNGVILQALQANTGGYHGYSNVVDNPSQDKQLFDGCQLLLNYWNYWEEDNHGEGTRTYRTFSLEEFLATDFSNKDTDYTNRIVLIGVDRSDGVGDNWRTPYKHERKMPGVIIHAQMISQILNAALEEKDALIWVLPQWMDSLLILGFALLGGGLAWWFLPLRQLGIIQLGIIVVLTGGSVFIISVVAFQFNGWIPLMPHFLALSATSSCVWYSNLRLKLGTPEKR
ncbi:MAG: CHASE2 domain-containing protein [Cyanobacteria bacterium P01_H01_bin.21]